MPLIVDETIQEANVLHAKALKYQDQLVNFGVTAEELASLITARDDVIAKDTYQKELMNARKEKTTLQNASMEKARLGLQKIKEIAKIVYDEDRDARAEFHIGKPGLKSVKSILTELAYIKEVATRRQDDLKTRGLTDEDITKLDDLRTELSEIDTEQEMSKRDQVTASSQRTVANRQLQKIIKRIRKSAEVCFADNADILHEFKRLD